MEKALLIVNFGGPRTLSEIEPFLKELLCDQEVVRTGWPDIFHRFFFTRIARKRAKKISAEYEMIGGGSPIYGDTEFVANALRSSFSEVLTFHRYLPETHGASLKKIQEYLDRSEEPLTVFPLFPQFTYATTGSIAKLFCKALNKKQLNKLRWIKSFSSDPRFTAYYQRHIREGLVNMGWKEEETLLLFSAHGIPAAFVREGDPYQRECEEGYSLITKGFSLAKALLCYQSQFGKEEWIRPYTKQVCLSIDEIAEGRKRVLFVPFSFTSDHIETLFEVEHQYIPLLKDRGYEAARLPAFNRDKAWIELITKLAGEIEPVQNAMLVRCNGKKILVHPGNRCLFKEESG